MKKWNFKVKSNPQEIINKLDISLGSVAGFVFNTGHDKNDSVIFNMRKRVHYPDQILHRNRIIVNGKILKTDAENETDVEIYFKQHYLMTLIIYINIFFGLGLIATIPGISSNASMYIPGGILVAVGIVLWIALQKKFEKDIQKYKTLISEILAS
jgi:hypothetical protein